MPVFHTDIVETNTSTTSALQRLHDALTKLWSQREALEDFEGFEREVHALFVSRARGTRRGARAVGCRLAPGGD